MFIYDASTAVSNLVGGHISHSGYPKATRDGARPQGIGLVVTESISESRKRRK
jgi:hypothetical protein